MRSISRFAALAIAAIALSACAGMSNVMPGPLNGFGKDPMSKVFIGCSLGHCTPEQWTLAGVAAGINGEQIENQISTPAESIGTGAVTYGAGYAAGGTVQALAYRGASAGAGALLNGTIGTIGGGINDAHAWSYGDDAGNGAGTDNTLKIWAKGIGIPQPVLEAFGGQAQVQNLAGTMYAIPAYVRSKNRTPEESKKILDQFHGHQAGTPVQ